MSDSVKASHKEHLQELRDYLRLPAVFFISFIALGFHFSQYVIDYIKSVAQVSLVSLHPYEVFMVKLDAGLYTAFIFTLPIVFLQVIRFFKPGMTNKEYRTVRKYVPVMFLLSGLGLFAGGTVLAGMTTEFLRGLASGTGVSNMWSISSVLSYMMRLSLSTTLMFNTPLLVLSGVELGLISVEQLKQYRRHVMTLSLVAAAMLSPPDLLSMFFLAVPTYSFYEVGIKASGFLNRES